MKRKYPRQAWMLMPSFKPVEVTVIAKAYTLIGYSDFDRLSSGKPVHFERLHRTQAEAIAAGREQVAKAEADLLKRRANLDKKIKALDKAEKEQA